MKKLFSAILILGQILAVEKIYAEEISAGEKAALFKILADPDHFSDTARQIAFNSLLSTSPKTEPHYISYCKPEEIALVKEVSAPLYSEIVKYMTISCIDIFIYNFETKSYLMVHRATSPAKGMWWMPGGRIFKGESFYESAVRKAKKESGLDICPIAQLGTYSTYFPDSAWGDDIPTDTKNTVVLALCNNQPVLCDNYHEDFKWIPIDEVPDDLYILYAYKEAKDKLTEWGFL